MNIQYTGEKIAELRKAKNLSQKEFASMVHVTDKAVSKWERGLNYPDVSRLELIARVLDTSVVELLGIEDDSGEEVADQIVSLSLEETHTIGKDLIVDGSVTIVLGIIFLFCSLYASYLFDIHVMYGLPQRITMGMCGFEGTLIAIGIRSIRKGRRMQKV